MTFYNQKKYFKNGKLDVIIFVGASITLMYSILTVNCVYIGDTDINPLYRPEVDKGFMWEFNIQLVLAPIILIHRVFIMLAAEYNVKRLNSRNIGLKLKCLRYRFLERLQNEYMVMDKKNRVVCCSIWVFMFCCLFFLVGVMFA